MPNQRNEHGHIDWDSLNKFLAQGGEPSGPESSRESLEFDRVVEPLLKNIWDYCQKNKIPFVAGFALLDPLTEEEQKSQGVEEDTENEEKESIGTRGRSLVSIPMDTDHTVCELVACSLILQMPHEFAHFVIQSSRMWMMMGGMTGMNPSDLLNRFSNGTDNSDEDDDQESEEE